MEKKMMKVRYEEELYKRPLYVCLPSLPTPWKPVVLGGPPTL